MAAEVVVQLNMQRLLEIDRRVTADLGRDLAQALALYVEGQAKAKMGTGRPGRPYRRGARIHTASAPGSPPAIDTGALRASIHTEQAGAATFLVADGVEYGAHLEFGTRKMAARPFMQPAIDDMNRHAQALIQTIVDRIIR